jgi:hypothetical protein
MDVIAMFLYIYSDFFKYNCIVSLKEAIVHLHRTINLSYHHVPSLFSSCYVHSRPFQPGLLRHWRCVRLRIQSYDVITLSFRHKWAWSRSHLFARSQKSSEDLFQRTKQNKSRRVDHQREAFIFLYGTDLH